MVVVGTEFKSDVVAWISLFVVVLFLSVNSNMIFSCLTFHPHFFVIWFTVSCLLSLPGSVFKRLWDEFRSCLASKDFLRSINDVEESILISFPLIKFSQSHWNCSHVPLIDQQKESLIGMQLQSPSNDFHQLSDCHMIRDQELASVQDWKLFLSMKSFDDDRDFVGVKIANLFYILFPLGYSFMWQTSQGNGKRNKERVRINLLIHSHCSIKW